MKKKKTALIVSMVFFVIVLVMTLTSSKAETFHSVEQEEVLQIEEWMTDEQTWKL